MTPDKDWQLTLADGRKVTVGATSDRLDGVWLLCEGAACVQTREGTLLRGLAAEDVRAITRALTAAAKHFVWTSGPATSPATMPQTLILLQLARGTQPKYMPPITRRELSRKGWITRDGTGHKITAIGDSVLAASKHLAIATRKLDAGTQATAWQGMQTRGRL